jgi:spermidine/putrescine transport system ATP-binding protein
VQAVEAKELPGRGAAAAGADKRAAVDVRGVSKVFGGGEDRVVALDDVSVTIRENEFFTLLGPSGCGKTTLLRLIAGFEHPTAGGILLDGADISALPPFRRPVNTVFQSYALFPHMTVAENIGFGLKMQDKPKAEVEAAMDEMLRLVQMEELKHRQTSQISGGQQQRVALARALAPHPKVLLLDEPLSALDLKLRKEMQIELKRLQHETGITFIFVTHDQEEALTMSDRIAVMNQGRILQVGAPREIYDHPARRFVADFIGEINILSGEMVSRDSDLAEVRFASGETRRAGLPAGDIPEGRVNVAIRPEHVTITAVDAPAAMTGTVTNIVYFGAGTHYHLETEDGTPIVVEVQNQIDRSDALTRGERVGIEFPDGTLQMLSD